MELEKNDIRLARFSICTRKAKLPKTQTKAKEKLELQTKNVVTLEIIQKTRMNIGKVQKSTFIHFCDNRGGY